MNIDDRNLKLTEELASHLDEQQEMIEAGKKLAPEPELSKKRAHAGRRGGLVTFAKYGVSHFKAIGRRGAKAFHRLYKFEPVGTSDFAVVNRETNEVIAFLSGRPF